MMRSALFFLVACVLLTTSISVSGAEGAAPRPVIVEPWWTIAENPDLGAYQRENQQPVDFAVWQAADGSWQLWSCIRHTGIGGHTRLFYGWEAERLEQSPWEPMGIKMVANPTIGEAHGGLQAPYVMRIEDTYYMFYGDWNNICLARSQDGKNFTRVVQPDGEAAFFSGPYSITRDPMVMVREGTYYCYYTCHDEEKNFGADYCRTSTDLTNWSEPILVATGGSAGGTCFAAECPHVIPLGPWYYFSRTQLYGEGMISRMYCSPDPLDFGVDDDKYLIGSYPIAAPEFICHQGEYYIACLRGDLQGIKLARLNFEKPSSD